MKIIGSILAQARRVMAGIVGVDNVFPDSARSVYWDRLAEQWLASTARGGDQ